MVGKTPFTVGDWLVEPQLDRISRDDDVRSLRPQVMELLVFLAAHPGSVVPANILLSELWDGRIVTEGSVYNCVSELRAALTGPEDKPLIETIPRRGYRLVAPVAQVDSEGSDQPSDRNARPARALVLTAMTVVATGALAWLILESRPGPTHPSEIRSLAVLPLDNLSSSPEQDEYFTHGMTEALIARLGRIPELRVISRTSAMQLKQSDMTIPQIAEALHVDGVVEGSVMTAEDEVRITLQLIDGATDTHLWTNSYIRSVDDILDLQTEMANSIASELQIELAGPAGDRHLTAATSPRTSTSNAEAYRAYMKGRYFFTRFGENNFRSAIDFYLQAIELDPGFALAYASLAEACMQPLVIVNGIRTLQQCEADALTAVDLDDELAEANAALGFVRLVTWRLDLAEARLTRAIELDPNSVMARQWYAEVLRATYRYDEALAQIHTAEDLDPLNLFVKTMVGWPLYNQRSYERALAQWDDVIEMDSGFMLAHYNQGLAYIELGRADDVFAAAERVANISGERSFESRLLRASAHAISGERDAALQIVAGVERDGGAFLAAWIASIYLMIGDEDQALARLEQGVEDRAPDMLTISEPKFDSVRSHPRFKALSRQIGLPEIG